MRILFLTEAPSLVGSSRVLAYQYRPYLEDLGLEVEIVPPVSNQVYGLLNLSALDDRFHSRARRRLLRLAYRYAVVPLARGTQFYQAQRYDVVVVQRSVWYTGSPACFERLVRHHSRRLVYSYDDALYVHWPTTTQHRIELADAVLTGNEKLAEYARRFNSSVHVIESGVDTDGYYPEKPSYRLRNPPIIGWVGNPSNLRHLRLLEIPLKRLSLEADFRLRVVSSRPYEPAVSGLPIEFVPWALEREIENLMEFDIGVMPLHDSEYARGKEGYKLKQYMACGLPAVASPVGYNRKIVTDGQTGYLAATAEEWVLKLGRLLADTNERERLGRNGRDFVVEHYSTRQKAKELELFFRGLSAGSPFSTLGDSREGSRARDKRS
ncbi:MAG: glycosyltransferase family 4 protein [bacterium]